MFKSVDTCAAEFEAYTPYYYTTYEAPISSPGTAVHGLHTEDEIRPFTGKPRIMILGGGPNRIGQGIEFDYCCCQAAFALREAGYEDHHGQLEPGDGLDRLRHQDHLFFEPLTVEDVLNICDRDAAGRGDRAVRRADAANLAKALEAAGVPIIGTSVDSIDIAEDRERFGDWSSGWA